LVTAGQRLRSRNWASSAREVTPANPALVTNVPHVECDCRSRHLALRGGGLGQAFAMRFVEFGSASVGAIPGPSVRFFRAHHGRARLVGLATSAVCLAEVKDRQRDGTCDEHKRQCGFWWSRLQRAPIYLATGETTDAADDVELPVGCNVVAGCHKGRKA